MGRIKLLQHSLNSGILSPTAFGRVDIAKYYSSTKDSLNVNCHPHGGQFKRKGFKYISTLAGYGRLVKFAFNTTQAYILVFTDLNIAIYDTNTDTLVQDVTTLYTLAEVKTIGYTQSADTMIITHEDHTPRVLIRNTTTGVWSISDIALTNIPRYDYDNVFSYEYTNTGITNTKTVSVGESVFDSVGDNGTIYHVYEAISTRTGIDLADEDFTNVTYWADLGEIEAVISPTRGYPKVCTFFESRLWFAGLKSRPQTILGSVTNDFYNFNQGTSLADESIFDTLDTDQINPIVSIFPGRQLQVFTVGGEFANTSFPITPEDSSWTRYTNYGSKEGIRNDLMDGSTLFIDRSGRNLREFIYSYTEDAYTAGSTSTLAYDIINNPIDTTAVRGTNSDISNLIILINEDGTAAVFNTLRSEEVAGWTRWDTQGNFISIESIYDDLYVIAERDNGFFLEKGQDKWSDSFIEFTSGGPTITGLDHLEGQEVVIVADGAVMLNKTVTSGAITIERSFDTCYVGLGYNAEIETLPISPNLGGGSSINRHKRVLKTTIRVIDTTSMKVNDSTVSFRKFGAGILNKTLEPFEGIKEIRHLGYGRLENYRIVSDEPTPFKLLSLETEVTTR